MTQPTWTVLSRIRPTTLRRIRAPSILVNPWKRKRAISNPWKYLRQPAPPPSNHPSRCRFRCYQPLLLLLPSLLPVLTNRHPKANWSCYRPSTRRTSPMRPFWWSTTEPCRTSGRNSKRTWNSPGAGPERIDESTAERNRVVVTLRIQHPRRHRLRWWIMRWVVA